jgi:ribosomal-protein-alanine acetyltransferase
MGGGAGAAVVGVNVASRPMIRPARADDVDAIHAIELASFTDPWSRTSFRDSILGDGATIVVAAGPKDTVLGFGVLVTAADEAEIANVAVAAGERRRGVGAALVEHMIAVARMRGAAAVYLDVRESNSAARALYLARGFTEVRRRKCYYRMPDEDAVVMRLALVAGLQ